MKKTVLNITANLSPQEIHQAIARQLDFPVSYGHNLDALYDCLTSLSEETKIYLLDSENNPDFSRFKKVMQAAAGNNTKLKIIIE